MSAISPPAIHARSVQLQLHDDVEAGTGDGQQRRVLSSLPSGRTRSSAEAVTAGAANMARSFTATQVTPAFVRGRSMDLRW